MQRLMKKVREMQSQRLTWESQLRTDLQNDDITKQLVTAQEPTEQFFKNELEKHKKLVQFNLYYPYLKEVKLKLIHIT